MTEITRPDHRPDRLRLPAAWLILIVFDVSVFALACAQDDRDPAVALSVERNDHQVAQIDGPPNAGADEIRFEAIDVFVDSGAIPLAAWQVEIASQSPGVEITGIEGGEHPAFQQPPYYDPAAMRHDRVILAAFNTGDDLPSGNSRVARIHLQLQGPGVKEYRTLLKASATVDGNRIPAKVTIRRSEA